MRTIPYHGNIAGTVSPIKWQYSVIIPASYRDFVNYKCYLKNKRCDILRVCIALLQIPKSSADMHFILSLF